MIVKVQLPIAGDMGQALIYDEERTIVMTVPVGPIAKRFRPGETRAFFDAAMTSGDVLEIGERVKEQSW